MMLLETSPTTTCPGAGMPFPSLPALEHSTGLGPAMLWQHCTSVPVAAPPQLGHICIIDPRVHSSWLNGIKNTFCFHLLITEKRTASVRRGLTGLSAEPEEGTEVHVASFVFLRTDRNHPQPRENDTATLNFKVSCTDKYI